MTDIPTESETKPEVPEVETKAPEDPATEFRKGKAKREAKRKEVRVITEYSPPPPPPAEIKAELAPVVDEQSIADRVAAMVFERMAVEKVATPKTETKAKAKPGPKKKAKSTTPPPSPPPTKYFGWC